MVTALLEVAGIASVFPILALASQAPPPWLRGLQPGPATVGLLGLVFLGLFTATSGAIAFTWALCLKLAHGLGQKLSVALLARFLQRPYSWYLGQNTLALGKRVVRDLDELVERLFRRLCESLVRGTAGLFICLGLVWLEPAVALTTACTLSLLYAAIYRFFSARLAKLGTERVEAASLAHRLAHESLSALKEARAYAGVPRFLARYEEAAERMAALEVNRSLVALMPRYLTEVLALGAIMGVLVYLVARGYGELAVPLVGVYAMATWRLVPCLQDVYHNAVEVRICLPVLLALADELREPLRPAPTRLELHSSVQLEGVTFAYPGADRPAVLDFSLTLPRGGSLALVGPSGAGKSTVADLLAGYLEPTRGRLLVDGRPVADPRAWQANVGYLPQEVFLLEDTLAANIALGAHPDPATLERAVSQAGLTEFVARLPRGLATPLHERGLNVSGGERQRIGLARALYPDPEVLVLDEPTSALDGATEQAITATLAALRGRKTVVVIAHRLTTVEGCEQVVELCF